MFEAAERQIRALTINTSTPEAPVDELSGGNQQTRHAMIRRAFTMRLTPGSLAEYKRHHEAIWPELVAEIERQGIARMTIFEDDPVLFLYSEIQDEEAWDRLWHSEIHDRWGEIMNPLMEFGPDGVVDSHEVREVFNLETSPPQGAAAGSRGPAPTS